jgi:hypothetical protein
MIAESASRLGTYFFRKWGRGGRGPGAKGSPTRPLTHRGRGAWLAAQNGKGELCTALELTTKLQLAVSGPSGKRARRREAARLAQRQGAARRSGKTRLAVAPPRLLGSFLPCECWSFWQTQLCDKLCSLINQLQNYNKSSALINPNSCRPITTARVESTRMSVALKWLGVRM